MFVLISTISVEGGAVSRYGALEAFSLLEYRLSGVVEGFEGEGKGRGRRGYNCLGSGCVGVSRVSVGDGLGWGFTSESRTPCCEYSTCSLPKDGNGTMLERKYVLRLQAGRLNDRKSKAGVRL